ncbi:MAG: nucleotidyltransferase family protein [Myxococcota bacterium]
MIDMEKTRAGIFQSLAMQAVRTEWRALGRDLRVPVVFFKGAWSEPVLHRGTSVRLVSDVDVLIPARAWSRVAQEAARRGWEPVHERGRRVSHGLGREQSFTKGLGLAVDLHRAIAEPPRSLDPGMLIAQARYYPSEDGPILSFCPEHQVAAAAVNHANDGFLNDPRSREDIQLLLQRHAVDWHQVVRLARHGGFLFGLRWMVSQLSGPIPRWLRLRRADRRRVELIQHLRRGALPPSITQALEGVVFGQPAAQSRWMLRYGIRRVLDRLPASWVSVG